MEYRKIDKRRMEEEKSREIKELKTLLLKLVEEKKSLENMITKLDEEKRYKE